MVNIKFNVEDKEFNGTIEELAKKYEYTGCLDCLNRQFADFKNSKEKAKKPKNTNKEDEK